MSVYANIDNSISIRSDFMKARHTFRDVVRSLKNNLFKYIVIWSIAELIGYLFLKGTTFTLINLAIKNMGISGITNENYSLILQSPFAFLLVFIALISLGVLAIVQTLATFTLSSKDGNIKNIFKPLKRLKPKDILPLILYAVLIVPFSNVGLTVYFLSNLKIPDFIMAVVLDNTFYSIIYYLFLTAVLYLNLKLYYTFIIFYKEEVSFSEAMKLSFEATEGKSWYIIRFTLLITMVAVLLSIVVAAIFVFFNGLAINYPVFERLIVSFGASLIVILGFLIIIITSIYYLQFVIISYTQEVIINETKANHKLFLNSFIIALLVITVYGMIIYTPQASFEDVKIIAHRGVTEDAIENTVESLEAAKAKNADYVELDVQQLKDGTLIVFHDPNFKRLTNLNKKVGEVTWEEIQHIPLIEDDLISYIPRFDEYLEVAAAIDQPLLIEIKANPSDDANFVQSVLDTVNNSSLNKEDVLYQSLSKESILKIKELQPEAYTGYIIGINLGGLENFDTDAYSIDETSVTKRVVIDARRYEKDLFIWSVDTMDVIERALSKKPAGIITDQIDIVEGVKEDLISNPLSRMLWQLNL